MTIEQFRKHMADGLPVENGSEAHLLMHEMSQQALRITAEINGKYHEPAELRKSNCLFYKHLIFMYFCPIINF